MDEATIRQRWKQGIVLLFSTYMDGVDEWLLYDTSSGPAVKVASGGRSRETAVYVADLWEAYEQMAGISAAEN